MEDEFPAPVQPPVGDVSQDPDETEVALVPSTVVKSCRPRLPVIFSRLTANPRLKAVEQFIASFEYSLHPQTNFNSQKQRPLFLIMETAKAIINAPQPIKCVEAVFVALFLTAGLPDVERYPLSFQTVLDDQVYQHIVLVVQHFGKFGAFGISRWPEFCSKDIKFRSMSGVIGNYKTAYEEQHHIVEKIRVGLPVEHNTRSTNFVCWRHLELDLKEQPWQDCVEAIDEFAAKGKRLWNSWIRSGRGEDPRHLYVRQTKRMLADRESSPYMAKRQSSERSCTLQARALELAGEAFETPEAMDFTDSRIVNCTLNIQAPSSRESARIALSLEPGEVSYFWKPTRDSTRAPGPVLPREFLFDNSSAAVHLPSKHCFSRFRRSKKLSKSGAPKSGDAVTKPVKPVKPVKPMKPVKLVKPVKPEKSCRGVLGFAPRAESQSAQPPISLDQCILGTKYRNAAPGFDGPKASWECLRTLYRTKNEARLLLLKDKLSDLRTQGPTEVASFHAVQEIFQHVVGIGEAVANKLGVVEETLRSLSENVDAVVRAVSSQNEEGLKQLAKRVEEEARMCTPTDVWVGNGKRKGLGCERKSRSSSPRLRKSNGLDGEVVRVHYRVPPCNWCGVYGHRMRECHDLEVEIARRVREYKLRICLLPHGPCADPGPPHAPPHETEPPANLVLWHKNRPQGGEKSAEQNAHPVTQEAEELELRGEPQLPAEKATKKKGSKLSKKKRLVQRRLRTKLMYLLGKCSASH